MPLMLQEFYKLSERDRALLAERFAQAVAKAYAEALRRDEEKPVSAYDMIGYCRKYHPEYRSTADIMKELREEEED